MLDVANGHTTRHRPAAGGVVVSWPDPAGAPAAGWPHRHLLDVDQLTRDQLEECLDLAVEMRERRLRRGSLGLERVARGEEPDDEQGADQKPGHERAHRPVSVAL